MRHLPRIALAVAASIAMLPAPAAAGDATASTSRDGNILWIEVTTSVEDDLRIKIFQPAKGDRAHGALWQKCHFATDAAATYRCGIDVGKGSAAARKDGRWLAHAVMGGAVQDRVRFRT